MKGEIHSPLTTLVIALLMKSLEEEKVFTKKFTVSLLDSTATNGVASIRFDPTFDKVPSTGEPVDRRSRVLQYSQEVFGHTNVLSCPTS